MNNSQNNQNNRMYTNWNDSNNTINNSNNANLSNSQNNQNNGMYTNWSNTNRNNQYNPNDKPYLVMSDKEIKNKKRTSAALRLAVYGIFIIVGAMVYYMYQIDKYEFYPKKDEVLIANESKYQIELTPKNAENFDYLNYKYEIEDENIAEVNEYGEIKAKGIGETNLKIKYKYGFNYKTVKIKTENIEVEKIEVKEEKEGNLEEGESVEIKTIVNDNEEINKNLGCRSSDERVAIIDDDCKTITPIEEGEAKIIVEDPKGEEQEELEIVVEPKEVEVERVEVVETKIIIKKGTRGKIEAEVVPENATRKGLKYTSDNGNVTVDGEGNVTGNNVGTSVITIESENGKKGYCTVEVEEESIEIEEIKIKEQEKKLKEGEEYQLKTEIEPSNATERELKWTSNNQGIVSVTNGKIKGIRAGEAEITVETTSGKKATIKVTVEAKEILVEKINIKEKKVKIIKGSKYIIGTEIEPSNATNKKLTYKSNNGNVTVDATGVVFGKTVGKSVVTIESENGKKETIEIEVVELKVEPTGITINVENKEMIVGETGELLISLEPSDVTERGITWTSSNKNVVSVVNGKIVAQGGGEAEIIAETTNGLIAKCKVVVKVPVTKVTISGEETVKVNKSVQFKVGIEPSNATEKTVKWESVNNNVATVDKNGLVTGKTVGETRIRATVGGKSVEKKIIVESDKKLVETLNITPANIELKEGEEKEFKISIYPSDATDKSVTWRSNNPEVASVTNGKVKGLKAGETDIIVETKDKRIKVVGKVKVVPKVIEVSEVKIKGEKTVKLTKDSKHTLVVEVLPSNATNQNLTYKSSNTNVEVNKNGIVIGKKVGKSEVTITSSNGKTAKVTIEVEEKKVFPTKVKLNIETIELEAGKTEDILATLEPNNVTERTLSWESSNKEIVSVENGKIKGLKAGNATITVKTSNGLTAQCKVVVKVLVKKITVSGSDKIKVKQSAKYTATIEPSNASNKQVVWTSSDTNIAKVDQTGNVTGVKAGTVTIRATEVKAGEVAISSTENNNIYGEKTIVIEPDIKEVTSVTINPKEVTINENEKVNLSVDIKPSDASDKSVTWSSSDTKIAKVDNKGIVTGIKAGTTTIIVKSKNGKESKCKVTVKPVEVEVDKVTLNITNKTLTIGETLNLSAIVEPSNATNKAVTWKSSDTKIATVDKNGKVTTGSSIGTVKITATTNNGKKATTIIMVKEQEIKSISLSTKKEELQLDGTAKISITSPTNLSNKKITWSSSNSKIATVDQEGNIKGVGIGSAVITAKVDNKSDTCNIVVQKDQIHFINIGTAGNAILIDSNNKFFLIDAGNTKSGIFGTDRIVNYLSKVKYSKNGKVETGITKLDGMIISHMHYDHAEGAATVIEKYLPKTIYIKEYDDHYQENLGKKNTALYNSIKNAAKSDRCIKENRCNIEYIKEQDGQIIPSGTGNFTLKLYNTKVSQLKSKDGEASYSENINSVVVMASIIKEGKEYLTYIPGDLEKDGGIDTTGISNKIVKDFEISKKRPVDIYVAAHHGYYDNDAPEPDKEAVNNRSNAISPLHIKNAVVTNTMGWFCEKEKSRKYIGLSNIYQNLVNNQGNENIYFSGASRVKVTFSSSGMKIAGGEVLECSKGSVKCSSSGEIKQSIINKLKSINRSCERKVYTLKDTN